MNYHPQYPSPLFSGDISHTEHGGGGGHRPPLRPLRKTNSELLLAAARLLAGGFICLILLILTLSSTARWVDPPITAYMVGHKLLAWQREQSNQLDYRWVEPEQIPLSARHAVIAAEDPRFYEHSGFDFQAIRANMLPGTGEQAQNVSTLSQQVARNLFLWSERSWLRKLLEAMITVILEASCTKERLITLYLNTAEFGHGIFGIESAAQNFYQRPAHELTSAQSAALAAVLPYPGRWNPVHPNEVVEQRIRRIKNRMQTQFEQP